MTKLQYLLATLAIFSLNNAVADTRELADDFLLDGDFIGSGNGIVMFNSGTGASPLISGQSGRLYRADATARASSGSALTW